MTKRGHIFSKFLFLGLASATISMSNAAMADGATKFVGNITTRGQVRSDFGTYWNQITAENECKWASIQGGGPNSFNWNGCDAAYNWAKENGGHFKFHALIWGSQYPSWLNGLSVEETQTAIDRWFNAVAEHYPDLEMIDVVNEAIRGSYNTQGDYQNQYHSCYTTKPERNNEGKVQCENSTNKIMAALGGDNGQYDFITNAFKKARKLWHKNTVARRKSRLSKLILKIKSEKANSKLIQTIKKNGAPVDAYGLQSHDLQKLGGGANGTGGGGSCYELSNVKEALEQIWEGTQLPMFISEYDISEANDEEQKACYSQQISYFMENEHVAGITIWGYVNGATWSSNTGIINEDGTERAAMTWLKEYLSTHTGANTTGLIGSAEPQKPFNATNTPWAIPGKIEAEDFDIPGKGSGNDSYKESKSAEDGDSDYRAGTGVDLYKRGSGIVVGYNDEGDWLEYTVNIQEAGNYTFFAAVAADHAGGSFKMSLDGIDITDEIAVPANKEAAVEGEEENYNDYNKVSANVTFSENQVGEHVLRLTITGVYFDIDYFNFVKGQNAEDDVPLSSSATTSNNSSSSANNQNSSASDNPNSSASGNPNSTSSGENMPESSANGSTDKTDAPAAIGSNLHIATQGFTDYDIIDIHGVRIGRLSAHSTQQAIETAKYSVTIKSSGIYYIRSRATGKIQSLRIVR